MKISVTAIAGASLLALTLAGCSAAQLAQAQSDLANGIASVQSAAKAACGVVPTADTLAQLIMKTYPSTYVALPLSAFEAFAGEICGAAAPQLRAHKFTMSTNVKGARTPLRPVDVHGVAVNFL